MPSKVPVRLRVNGEEAAVMVPPYKTLLEVLREDLGLTGTKHGCELGECSTCAVLVDGKPFLSCLAMPLDLEGRQITTVKGLATGSRPHRLQVAFAELGAIERRLVSRDEQLDQRSDMLEQRDRKLLDRERDLDKTREELAKAHQEQVEALERVSGVSADDAKGLLLERVAAHYGGIVRPWPDGVDEHFELVTTSAALNVTLVDEQTIALRDAMRVLFPEAVALVSAARQGFMREH